MIWWFSTPTDHKGAVPALRSSLIDRVDGHAGVPDRPVRLAGTGFQVLVGVPDPRDRRACGIRRRWC